MRRRQFVAGVGAAAVLGQRRALGQNSSPKRVGLLVSGRPSTHGDYVAAFKQRLATLGYVEGKNIVLHVRWADGEIGRFADLAQDLLSLNPTVVVTSTTAAALAVTKANAGMPVVSALLTDPIGFGLVKSHSRPGGSVTGIQYTFETLPGKQIELAREVIPSGRFAFLLNASNPTTAIQRRELGPAGMALDVEIVPVDVRAPEEFDKALETIVHQKCGAVLVPSDTLFLSNAKHLAATALALRLPSVYRWREHVVQGGLLSYGIDLRENYRRVADYVDKILNGAIVGELPVEVPARFELCVNIKTAKVLGLAIAETFLVRADEVIE